MQKNIYTQIRLRESLSIGCLGLSFLISCTNSIRPAGIGHCGLIPATLQSSNSTISYPLGYGNASVLPITESTYLAQRVKELTQAVNNTDIGNITSNIKDTLYSTEQPIEGTVDSGSLLITFSNYLEYRNTNEAMEILQNPSFDVNARNHNNSTALMMSANKGTIEMVEKLLDRGADMNIRNRRGNTALIIAASQGKPATKVVIALLEKNAEVNIRNNKGYTALRVAVKSNNMEAVFALLNSGKIDDEDRANSYELAIKKEYPEIAALLKPAV